MTTLVSHLSSLKSPRTIHDDTGLWPVWHAASQYADYINCDGLLAATDGSASQHGNEMGGGVVYRYEDGIRPKAIPIRGIPSSLDAEAGAADVCINDHPLDTPLTILTDSYNLLLLIQSSLNPASTKQLADHEHKHILLPFMT
jgi:hypothetical protein